MPRQDDKAKEIASGIIGLIIVIIGSMVFCPTASPCIIILGVLGFLGSLSGSPTIIADSNKCYPPPGRCSKCAENTWELIEITKTGASGHWKCLSCGKKMYIRAVLRQPANVLAEPPLQETRALSTLGQGDPPLSSITARTNSLEQVVRNACKCRSCFGSIPGVETPIIAGGIPFDVPQPRWIGEKYLPSTPRVIILMTNPGSGEGSNRHEEISQYTQLLRQFRNGKSSLLDVFRYQENDMQYWGGSRPFIDFYTSDRGLLLENISFLNIAWCPTKGDKYPLPMLRACWQQHTARFLEFLRPDIIVLAGSQSAKFRKQIEGILPEVLCIQCLHHANRESAERNKKDACAVVDAVKSWKGKHGGLRRKNPSR